MLGVLLAVSALAGLTPAAAEPTAQEPPQAPRLLFQQVGDDEQLRDGVITGLAQDAQGFLWIGTTEGLVRFDGYRFKAYRHDFERPGSLPGNRIEHLFADREGRLWVGTYAQGVARYDARTETFGLLSPPEDPARPPRVPGPAPARAFAQTPDGAVWVGTSGLGLWKISADDAVTAFDASDTWTGLPDDRISALAVDASGDLWVGSWSGLAVLRAGSERFERVLSDPEAPDGFFGVQIRGLHAAGDGALWVGSQDGRLLRLPPGFLQAEAERQDAAVRRWTGMGLNDAVETADGRVWIAHARGLELFAADGSHLGTYRHRTGERYGMTDRGVRDLLVDRSGWLWLGSFGGGLLRTYPGAAALSSRRLDPERDAPLTSLSLSSLAADDSGGLWAVADGYGLIRLDSTLEIRERIPLAAAGQTGLSGVVMHGLARDVDAGLWVATEQGLFHRPGNAQAFQRVTQPDFIEGKSVRRVWPGPRGEVWIATGDGLFVRRADGQVQRLATAEGQRVGGAVNSLQFDATGAWMGGAAGLFRVDTERLQLQAIPTEVDGRLRTLDVLGVLLDARGQLWVDAGGLQRLQNFDGDLARLQSISAQHGLEGVAFGANLLDDARGRIWSQRFMYDPAQERLHPLGVREGALAGAGWFRAYARLSDGRFAFGMNEGLLVVDGARFDSAAIEAPVVFTGLRVEGSERPLPARADAIVLQPNERAVAIEFAALDFSAPQRMRYRYRLQGHADTWIEVGADARVASFGGLWPGEYRLQVQASTRAGQFEDSPLELVIRVLPAWWQQPVLIAAMAVLLALLIEGMVRMRRRRLERQRLALQAEVQARTAELTRLGEELERRSRIAEEASLTDPLTGLRNRRFAEQELPREAALYQRRPVAATSGAGASGAMVFFLLDLDHFKRVNDEHGHAAGDAVLREVAARLVGACRASDHVIRWGGEEFLIVARDSDHASALGLAERLRQCVAETPFDLADGASLKITASIGFAPFPLIALAPFAASWDEVVDLADRMMLSAKRAGRDAWVGFSVVRASAAPQRCVQWLEPERFESGDVRVESNRPQAEVLAVLSGRAHSAQAVS